MKELENPKSRILDEKPSRKRHRQFHVLFPDDVFAYCSSF